MTRLRKPLVCAGLAAGLATSLVVNTPYAAEALIPILAVPIIAAAGGGTAVSGVTLSGAAAMIGLAGVGSWLAAETPWSDEVGDNPNPHPFQTPGWLKEMFSQPEDTSMPVQDEPREFYDDWLPFDSTIGGDPSAEHAKPQDPFSSDPAGNGQVFGELTGATLTPVSEGSTNYSLTIKATMTSKPDTAHYGAWNVRVKSDYACKNKSSGVMREGSGASYLGSVHFYDELPSNLTSTPALCDSGEELQTVTIGPASSADLEAYAQTGTVTGTQTLYVPGYKMQDMSYLTGIDCVHPTTGVKTTLYMNTPVGGGAVGVPSCHAAGVGTVGDRIFTDFVERGKPRQPLWEIQPKVKPSDVFSGDTSWTDCDPGFGPVCRMEIWINGVKCEKLAPACLDWLEHTTTNPGAVECKYGGRTVHVSYCYGMESFYKGQPHVADMKNADGDPNTSNPTAPYVPQQAPEREPWKIPLDVPSPGPSTDPDVHTPPVTDPLVDPLPPHPDVTVDPNPPVTDPVVDPPPGGPGVDVANPPVAPPGTSTSCWGARASWNPIEWVYQPVVCAMQAVFQPTKPIQERVTSMTGHFSNKVPVSWFGMGTEGISGGACPTSWKVEFRGESHSLICGTAADGMIRSFRPVLGAMLVIAAVFPLMRSLFYSAIPLFRVTPS